MSSRGWVKIGVGGAIKGTCRGRERALGSYPSDEWRNQLGLYEVMLDSIRA